MELFSHVEIIVSKNGKHLFATHPRSLRDKHEADTVYKELYTRFPKNEGFDITVTGWVVEGEDLTAQTYVRTVMAPQS